ncbi:hypothetical protein LTR10_016415 [Elasticomyces elasticus]|uniref:DUF7514 domain-containing protein n=1 Tax=Exophiala sideris TaxID=1016849 RepID=A0ABR0JBW6_9EURO|nr:hypothetical protein LTR10_016415 [Elasticomyces elasticus]KAK5031196.1 hypothetical protein LTS07_004931 [Exophiala sideris]KAK5038917.1 hypothetical protein LTR13_003948 [Exophiala sideris]KAK5060801.1 hypothetical protein LTR69_005400 [Exophiala sideris]KAK5183713.1 hypothetical protein LTR44_003995 [Eurotiomycetes sp. CCFEE 6388]
MNDTQTTGHGFWRYLINPDKSATTQLEHLCLGLAKIIPTLEPGSNDELTPQRLAAFYRAVGGNYDALFLKTSESALSFMYQTLGCFHSLQPTSSPFEHPRIPCLTPAGFARWQTIQILLCPEENVGFMQKAVQRWNVPMPNGNIFPKYIPQSVFPAKADEEMENWHRDVTGRLNQQKYMQRIKNSPHQSPYPDLYDRKDGYFSGAQPTRHSRSSSRDDQHNMDAFRRRSSVPNFPSPGERAPHWDPRTTNEAPKARSHSAQRPPPPLTRQRSQTTSGPTRNRPQQSAVNSPPQSRRVVDPNDPAARRSSAHAFPYRSPARTPSTVDEDNGSEASSETSQPGRRHRRSDEDRKSRPSSSSLWLPSFMRSHKRRHSSDAGSRAPGPKHSPLRPEPHPPRALNAPQHPSQVQYRAGGPHWRDTSWDSDPALSGPTMTTQAQAHFDPRGPSIRYPDQSTFEPLTRQSSAGSQPDQRYRSSDAERGGTQKRHVQGGPLRVSTTVTGVSGRRYPTGDPMSPIDRQRTHASGRGGVPAMV